MYLEVNNLTVIYDKAVVLKEVSFLVNTGELVGVVGPNGAGKSTALNAVAGLVKWEIDTLKGTTIGKITLSGSVILNGEEIIGMPAHEIAKRGLTLCPERGKPLREMTVRKNLEAGAYMIKDKKSVTESLEWIYKLFPILKAREKQVAGVLSGGERAMLAISRSLMSQAKLMLIDEPSVGLAATHERLRARDCRRRTAGWCYDDPAVDAALPLHVRPQGSAAVISDRGYAVLAIGPSALREQRGAYGRTRRCH